MRLIAAALLACAGCGMLESPDAALVSTSRELEAHPPTLDLGGGRRLILTSLRIDPPRLAPGEGELRVACSLWAEGTLGEARLLFHGPDELALKRESIFSRWRLLAQLPRLKALARALADRTPPAPVASWSVGMADPTEAEVREEYRKGASGRPPLAAARLFARPSGQGDAWALSGK